MKQWEALKFKNNPIQGLQLEYCILTFCSSISSNICEKLTSFHIFHLQTTVQDKTREIYRFK